MRNIRQAFCSLIGNASLKNKILADISSGTLSHAYIIDGKKGSGKHTLAYLIAAALSCEKSHDPSFPLPCLECPSCKKILDKKSPDVICIGRDGKSTLGVDTIRFLRNDVHIVPNELDYKIYIIEDAHTMTPQAQNAFLLTLEEPPSYVKYFLLCEGTEALLETVKSRTQALRTELISPNEIDLYISERYNEAKQLKASDKYTYGELIMASDKCIGRAIDLLDQKEFKHILETRELAREFLEAAIGNTDTEKAYLLFKRFSNKRDELSIQIDTILMAVRDLAALQQTENAPLVFYFDRDEAITTTDKTNMRKLMSICDSLYNAQQAISTNANVKLTIIKLFSETSIL